MSLNTKYPLKSNQLETEHRLAFHGLGDVRNTKEQDRLYVLNLTTGITMEKEKTRK